MRVVLCPSAYAPDVGGVEEHVRNLANQLVGLGHVVEVWTPEVGGQPEAEVVESIPVRRLPVPLPAARFGSALRFVKSFRPASARWKTQMKRFRPDLIHVHCFGPNGIYATHAARADRIPLVISLHGETFMDDHDIFGRSIVMRWGLRTALSRAAAVTGCSEVTLDDARTRFGLPAQRGTVVFNGVDLTEPPPPGQELRPKARRYVLALGRLVPNKGFDLLLDAFVLVAAQFPDVDLVIGGAGSCATSLSSAVSTLGLTGRVKLLGRLDRIEVANAMKGAAVFVMPSRIEPFGIVILEAWRAGTPLVASNRGGPPEFVTESIDGLLVDPELEAILAAAISRLLTDCDFANQLVTSGLRRVQDFSWPAVSARYLEIYAKVLTPRPASPN